MPKCTASFINFEQLFPIFQGCLEIEVDYANYDLVVTARYRVRAYMYTINANLFSVYSKRFINSQTTSFIVQLS